MDRLSSCLTKTALRFADLRADRRGTVAVMMAFLFPVLAGGFGLAFEVSNWYMRTRAMQNAADAAAIAAASNGTVSFVTEARAVAARYGYVDGVNNITVTPTTVTSADNPACPADKTCYRVAITSVQPLYLSRLAGYSGNSVSNNGQRSHSLTSEAIAKRSDINQPVCLLGLDRDTSVTALTSNGGPKADFTGCTIMSNSKAKCNGSDLNAYMGIAAGSNTGCGNIQYEYQQPLNDPYTDYMNQIPSDLPAKCNNTYSQESKQGNSWSGGTPWAGTKNLSGTADIDGHTLICGDLRLTGDVTINAPDGAVLYVQNGLVDLQGYTLKTANGSSVTIVFTGDPNNAAYNHIITDNSGGSKGVLDIQAPKGGSFPGMAIYQDPRLTQNIDITYTGNSPTWNITGLTYFPNAEIIIKGAVGKSSNGAQCFVMAASQVVIDGTGSFFSQSPNGAGCKDAGLNMPMAKIPGRGQLVY